MNNEQKVAEALKSDLQFPVVGIGASAGGLEAVQHFLKAVPENSGMAYVFVQHLSPAHESTLPEILKKSASIPVHLITDNIHLEPNNLYIIPANKIVTAVDGILKLEPLNDKHHKKKVINLFFSSLAVVHQSYAVGVVLSGTLNDGTLGLQAIKAYGGITFAQDEASAAFPGMPQSAVRSGYVDFVLPPEMIVERLISINHPFKDDLNIEISDTLPQHDEEIFKQLLTVLRVRRGVDFTYYKTSTLKRRIVRRMALNSIGKPEDYLSYLRENKSEQDALYNDMLISVTNFFRDPASFELLCETIFPALIEQRRGSGPLRIWIAGCATGEEAYSMAICLQEQLGDKASAMKIQIFATDISETAIAKARTGIYRSTDLEGLSSSRLEQFFTKLDGNFQVSKIIRDMCVFAHHNLLKDPPFSKLDLISCRNVLIYLEPILQKRALASFHYALNDDGFLLLGKSESIGKNADLFSPYSNQEKIFRPIGIRARFRQVTTRGREQSFKDLDKNIQNESGKQDVLKIADDVILSKYAPAGVIVNDQFDIIQFRGITDNWLTLSPGVASLNILKMAREGLSFEIRNLLHLARKSATAVRKDNVIFKSNRKQHYVNIEVTMLTDAIEPHYLILFQNGLIPGVLTSLEQSQKSGSDPLDQRIEQLEKELLSGRADMRAITEDQEAVNEELQSANQELLSSSEELQSLNEELETSKEELQSTNEETAIVNNELLDRNEQLNNARAYTEAIISTIRDPLIILDKNLIVKRATGGFYTKFKVTENETEGRYLYELGNNQWDIPVLRNLLESFLPEKKILTDFEVSHVFPSIGSKIMILNARLLDNINGEQLILLAIEDITDKRKVEVGLAEVEVLFKESKERLKRAVDAAGLGTWDYNPLTGELIWDKRVRELFGLSSTDRVDFDYFISMIHAEDRTYINNALKAALAGAGDGEYETEFRTCEFDDKKGKWLKFKGKVYFNGGGKAFRFVGTALDITVQKLADESTRELLMKKDEFMSIASHELKTPITTLKASLQILNRMKDEPSSKISVSMIEQANKSMLKIGVLVEDLLNTSNLTAGQLHLQKTVFAISKVIEDCCHQVCIEGVFTIRSEGDLNLEVCADASRIEQIVINFVNNAIKYAPDSKEILIKIEHIGDLCKVSVIDTGPGIPPEQLPHLFDRYYRVDSSGSQYSGLGLGLYISAEIIKKHNGQIGVDSEIGKGSAFWFMLPIS